MRQLLSNTCTASDSALFRELFLQRLPSNIRIVLTSSIEGKTLEDIALLADKVVDIASPSISALAPTPTDKIDSLQSEVETLKRLIADLARERPPRPRCPSPRRRPR